MDLIPACASFRRPGRVNRVVARVRPPVAPSFRRSSCAPPARRRARPHQQRPGPEGPGLAGSPRHAAAGGQLQRETGCAPSHTCAPSAPVRLALPFRRCVRVQEGASHGAAPAGGAASPPPTPPRRVAACTRARALPPPPLSRLARRQGGFMGLGDPYSRPLTPAATGAKDQALHAVRGMVQPPLSAVPWLGLSLAWLACPRPPPSAHPPARCGMRSGAVARRSPTPVSR